MIISKKGFVSFDLIIGFIILLVGTTLIMMWAIGESFSQPDLSTFARWGIGLFMILIEVIRAMVKGGLK